MSVQEEEARVKTQEARADHIARLAQSSSSSTRFVRLPQTCASDGIALVTRSATKVRALGFVALRASVAARQLARVGHHHMVCFVIDEIDARSLPEVLWRAARTSTRGHVVVDLRPSVAVAPRARISSIRHVRERAPGDDATARVIKPDARLERALGFLERHRGAAGERWLRAAMESARRRRDEVAEARAARRLMDELAAHDDWRAARRLGFHLVGTMTTFAARADVAAALAHVLVAMGELTRAGSVLAAVSTEAAAQGEPVPRIVRVRRAELAFWQGRFDEARAALPAGPSDSAHEAVVASLIAWAVGDESQLPIGPSIHPRLARACLAEAHLAAGRTDEALAALGTEPAARSEALLEEALLERLRAACHGRPHATAAVRGLIEREGARGLERWGMRRTGVHLLHAVPALLQVVHDAEDELAALEGGCRWIRAHVGAEAAGLVALGDGPRLVAGDGLNDRDLSSDLVRDAIDGPTGRSVARGPTVVVSCPVRSQGVTIGLAIVRGRSEAAEALAEGASLLASLCAPAMRARLDTLALNGAGRSLAPEILGDSPAISAVRDAIVKAAATTFPVLIEGESGTGKELAARALHRLSARRSRRLSAVNCAALSDELVEAELFGYARGAFTGAVGQRAGLFEEAHGSTLLLDEVSELSARAQAKLLRALQEREIRRLGENVSRPVDVRVLAATNRPLEDEAGHGRFREDLLFRLAVVRIRLPALRERVEDIPRIAQAHWRRMLAEVGKHSVLGADALAALCRHRWPGNIRELQNVIAGLALAAPARGRTSARLVAQVLGTRGGLTEPHVVSLDAARRTFERQIVAAALARHSGRRSAAAHELGLTRQGLAKAMKRLGVESCTDTAGVA